MLDRTRYTAPLSCTINVTQRCNLRCLHCSASACGASGEMTSEQLMWLVETLVQDIGVFTVHISGGEPLLRKDLFDAFGYLSRHNVGSSIFSNATLVTEEVARRLAAEQCLQRTFHTSLDGPNAKTHDALRGAGAFDAAMVGIRHLRAAGMRVSALCIVSRLNLVALRETAQCAESLGIDSLSFGFAGLMGHARQHKDVLAMTKAEWDYAVDMVASLAHEYKSVTGGPILEWPKGTATRLSQMAFDESRDRTIGQNVCQCDICKESVAITPDGWMVPCNKFWDFKLGNVFEEDFRHLYGESEGARRIRELVHLRSDQLTGCRGCEYAHVCAGGCRADAYALSGSLVSPDKFRCLKRYCRAGATEVWCDVL